MAGKLHDMLYGFLEKASGYAYFSRFKFNRKLRIRLWIAFAFTFILAFLPNFSFVWIEGYESLVILIAFVPFSIVLGSLLVLEDKFMLRNNLIVFSIVVSGFILKKMIDTVSSEVSLFPLF